MERREKDEGRYYSLEYYSSTLRGLGESASTTQSPWCSVVVILNLASELQPCQQHHHSVYDPFKMITSNCNFLSKPLTAAQTKYELQLNCVDTFVVSDNKGTIHQDIQNVVRLISKRTFDERRVCLLYKDSSARLYNVVLIGAEGLSAQWEQVETMYSGMQAACAIVLLARLAGYVVSSIASKLKYGIHIA
jgi:putative lipoic acid-binding regulatory protein